MNAALASENIGLAHHFAKRYFDTDLERDDLIQQATLGLVEACIRFDPSRGTKISTYVAADINGRLSEYVEREMAERYHRSSREVSDLDIAVEPPPACRPEDRATVDFMLSTIPETKADALRTQFGIDGLTTSLDDEANRLTLTKQAIHKRRVTGLSDLQELAVTFTAPQISPVAPSTQTRNES